MTFEANCRTTAMGIMPHTDIEEALGLALGLDIPFWPQLPNISYYHDMFAQTAQGFPGMVVDHENRRLRFDSARFEQELVEYSRRMEDADTFALSGEYAVVFDRFMSQDLGGYHAIRGQCAGPISLGFGTVDEERRPIIYNDEIKAFLFDFIQRKASAQYRKLREKNPNAFVWLDEPALSYVFNAMYGYNDQQAKEDYYNLLQGLEGPKALHLCPNVNLPYLLELGVDLISFDAYQVGSMPREYASAAAEFLKGGGIISWGIVPTESASLDGQKPETFAGLLMDYWKVVSQGNGISLEQVARQAMVAPAKCCVRDMGERLVSGSTQQQEENCEISSIEEGNVNKAFAYLGEISAILKDRCGAH